MHIPLRKCIVCREKHPKDKLIRLSNIDKNIIVDTDNKDGRGIYICKKTECICLAKKRNILSKILKKNIDSTIYDNINKIIENEEK